MLFDGVFTVNNKELFELILCRAKDSISTELDGETIILDTASGNYSGLNSTGTFIWRKLEHETTIAALRNAMIDQYEITEMECLSDLLVLLKDLAENNLISIKK